MAEHFNELTPGEHERLSFLLEELGEAQQAIGKILRHGYDSYNPDDPGAGSNRSQLENELGHVHCAVTALCEAKDLTKRHIRESAEQKKVSAWYWMHHQDE